MAINSKKANRLPKATTTPARLNQFRKYFIRWHCVPLPMPERAGIVLAALFYPQGQAPTSYRKQEEAGGTHCPTLLLKPADIRHQGLDLIVVQFFTVGV